MSREKIVITGMGLLTPIGLNCSDSWTNLLEGVSGVDTVTRFDSSGYRTRIAAELPADKEGLFSDFDRRSKLDRLGQYVIHTATEAFLDAGLIKGMPLLKRTGVSVGSGLGGMFFAESQLDQLYQKGPSGVHPLTIPLSNPNAIASLIAREWRCEGPNMTISTACASGAHAIGQGVEHLRTGRADCMIVGGADAPIYPLTFAGFNALRVMSKRNESPMEAVRPFELTRDGFVMGEGAGILVLEKEWSARKRGAHIYGEVAGYGASNGGYHIVAPQPSGDDAAAAITQALNDAQLNPKDIHYVNAHGTGTVANDISETHALHRVFDGLEDQIHVSSNKAQVGHTIGAAGAIEAIFTVLSLYHSVEPATINLNIPDKECDLDYIPLIPRQRRILAALSNSFGFGNNNAALIFKKYEGGLS